MKSDENIGESNQTGALLINHTDLKKTVPMGSQEKWRQKQLAIFYKQGRPIFGSCNEKNIICRPYPGTYWTVYHPRPIIRTYPNKMHSTIIID
jgi:hypothetical protein